MKKILLILAAVTASASLFAQTQRIETSPITYNNTDRDVVFGNKENGSSVGLTYFTEDKYFRIFGGYYRDTKSAEIYMQGGHGDNGNISGFKLRTNRTAALGDGANFEIISTRRDGALVATDNYKTFTIDGVTSNIGMGTTAGNTYSLSIYRDKEFKDPVNVNNKYASILLKGGGYAENNSAFIDMDGGHGDNGSTQGFRIKTSRNAALQNQDAASFEIIRITRTPSGLPPVKDESRPSFYIAPNGNVGIQTRNTNGYQLAVDGTIGAREITVNTQSWADYVFKEDYNLRSLKEVENHINEFGHLPEIPTTEEVMENGVDLGEMNVLLLKKIEELTLYVIQQQKEIDSLKN